MIYPQIGNELMLDVDIITPLIFDEAVNTQMQSVERSEANEVHRIFPGDQKGIGKGKYGGRSEDGTSDGKYIENRSCYRCNMMGHIG